MSIEAMKQALEVIEAAIESGDWQIDGACDPSMAIHSLHEAIAEADKQEPVAWIYKDGTVTNDPDMADGTWTPLFTAPVHTIDISQERVDETAKCKHEWVGLTDEDIAELRREGAHSVSDKDFRAIEVKLKEKNT
jgi:hypothetical protein